MTTTKAKLIIIIDYIYSLTGGTENQVIKIINTLPKEKYDLYLFSLNQTKWLEEHRNELPCKISKFKIDPFNLFSVNSLLSFWHIFKRINEISPDIVITFFRYSNLFGVLVSKIAGVKNIISTRRDYGLSLYKKYLVLLKIANRYVSRIITNSENVKQLTAKEEKFNISKIDVIYNGIEPTNLFNGKSNNLSMKIILGIPPQNKVIGIVAGLRPMKRHTTFINAVAKLMEKDQNLSFVMVGDGPEKENLVNLAEQLNVKEHIHFVNWQQNILPYLSLFDIGINCSANEGLSNAIMEYMAHGIPSIVSNAGGNSELIENGINGYTFELDNVDDLCNKMELLLTDPQKRIEFTNKSKDKISTKMTLKIMSKEYDKIFSNLMNHKMEKSE